MSKTYSIHNRLDFLKQQALIGWEVDWTQRCSCNSIANVFCVRESSSGIIINHVYSEETFNEESIINFLNETINQYGSPHLIRMNNDGFSTSNRLIQFLDDSNITSSFTSNTSFHRDFWECVGIHTSPTETDKDWQHLTSDKRREFIEHVIMLFNFRNAGGWCIRHQH